MTAIGSSLSKSDDGTTLINRSALAQISGVRKQLTRGEFDAAMTAERLRIANNSVGLYQPGEEFSIVGEVGHRVWFLATGGSDAANAAASHGKTAIPPGGTRAIVLAAESNTVTATTGVPTGGNNGDAKFDASVGAYYTRTAGAWSVASPAGSMAIIAGALVDVNGTPLAPPPSARADSPYTKYGVTAFDTSRAVGVGSTLLIGTTDLTQAVSNERPRFSNYTRRCVIGATGTSEIRFVQMNAFDPDVTEKAFSVDIYIENPIGEFNAPNNSYIDVNLGASATTGVGSNYSRWSFSATYLKQGWNTLKFRQADTQSSTPGTGNLPTGQTHPADVGTGFDWTAGGARFLGFVFNKMAGQIVHIDQIRRPAKAKSVLVIGFDANGSSNVDNVLVDKVAPLFAKYGIRSYFTYTKIYELQFAGSTAWTRMASLYNDWGWDAANHTWNHGASAVGTNALVTVNVVADTLTATWATGVHGVILGTMLKAKLSGGSVGLANGVFDFMANTTTTMVATATGAGTVTPTGTILFNTFLSEVLAADTPENRRIAQHELTDIASAMKATGFARGSCYSVYPNGAYMNKDVCEYASALAGIKIGRCSRTGYTNVNEFGIDNPLAVGAFEMTSGASGTVTSGIAAKVTGAIERGDHIQIFGHFIVDDTDPARSAYWPVPGNNAEYPPANNGNPNPPSASLSGTGGWWYYSQLENLVVNTIAPAIANGSLLVMSPSQYAAYMGYTR